MRDFGTFEAYDVELAEPLGGRLLLEGACVDGEFSEACPDGDAPTARPVNP